MGNKGFLQIVLGFIHWSLRYYLTLLKTIVPEPCDCFPFFLARKWTWPKGNYFSFLGRNNSERLGEQSGQEGKARL